MNWKDGFSWTQLQPSDFGNSIALFKGAAPFPTIRGGAAACLELDPTDNQKAQHRMGDIQAQAASTDRKGSSQEAKQAMQPGPCLFQDSTEDARKNQE